MVSVVAAAEFLKLLILQMGSSLSPSVFHSLTLLSLLSLPLSFVLPVLVD